MWNYKSISFFNDRLTFYRTASYYFKISITISKEEFVEMQLGWFGFSIELY